LYPLPAALNVAVTLLLDELKERLAGCADGVTQTGKGCVDAVPLKGDTVLYTGPFKHACELMLKI
jgi:hypothetical protein